MNGLPDEVNVMICSFCDVKTRLMLRNVSVRWRKVIKITPIILHCKHDTIGSYFKYIVENTLCFDDEEDFSLEKLFFTCNEHRIFKLINGGERHKVNCGEDHFWLTSTLRCESCDAKWFWDLSSVNLMSISNFDIFSERLIGQPKRYE